MKKIVFLFLLSALALGGCNMSNPRRRKGGRAVKKRAKAELRDENTDVDFQAFVGRLKKAVSAHDANTLASMMTRISVTAWSDRGKIQGRWGFQVLG